jgi:Ca-activated chloride channel family protein
MKHLILLLFALNFIIPLNAQEKQPSSPIVFIYDASGSMWAQMQGKTKMEIASSVLSQSVNNLQENQKIGLVAYGHRKEGDCEDVEFLVDMGNESKDKVTQALKSIKPLGKTPLAYSATLVIDRLKETGERATVILVTDGIESCGGNICDVVKAAKEDGIDFRLHIIGFGLKAGEMEQLECAAKAGDGRYYDAADAGGLAEVLNEATATTVDKPVDNFSLLSTRNGKPFDAVVRAFEPGTKNIIASARTYGDTSFFYLPAGIYDLEVIPLENSKMESIFLSNVESFDENIVHKTVSFDGGKIVVNTLNNEQGWDAAVKIYSKASGQTVASGRTYGKPDEYELNPGIYDISVQALVLEGLDKTARIENITVEPNEISKVEHVFKSGIAMIGAKSGSTLVDCVLKIVEKNSKQQVAGRRTYTSESSNPRKFILNPGTYEVSLTALGEHAGKAETITIQVIQGETVEKIVSF